MTPFFTATQLLCVGNLNSDMFIQFLWDFIKLQVKFIFVDLESICVQLHECIGITDLVNPYNQKKLIKQ